MHAPARNLAQLAFPDIVTSGTFPPPERTAVCLMQLGSRLAALAGIAFPDFCIRICLYDE
ncbi:hypothetical protein THIOKS11350022 [Thiocapsa sp. KS1]|nr:hypothetical protein THIOKS11350022 [Thiocapsa sp. KS1]